MVTWHVGGPDLGVSAPRLLEIFWIGLLLGNLLGLDFFLGFDFFFTYLDCDGRFFVDLGLFSIGLCILYVFLGRGGIFLDLLGSLLRLCLIGIDGVLFFWVQFWNSFGFCLDFLFSVLFGELFFGFCFGFDGGILGILSSLGCLSSCISGLLGGFSGTLGSLELCFSFFHNLDFLLNFLISVQFSSDALSLEFSIGLLRFWSFWGLLWCWSCSIIGSLNLSLSLLMVLLTLSRLLLMHILNINGDALHLRLGLLDDYGVDLSLGQTSEKSSNDK